MPHHWLDANVYIEAKNGPFSFAMAPGFWNWVLVSAKAGLIRSPKHVLFEIRKRDDQLSRWLDANLSCGLFVSEDKSVVKDFATVATGVQEDYEPAHAQRFLDSADPWVIAYAMNDHGVVVTHEVFSNG